MNNKMKAFVRTSAETQEVELQEVRIPVIQADEVLIKVEAFGVGIHDRYFIPLEVRFPYIIGSEGAGVIKEKGSQIKGFNTGDKVIFTTILQMQGGCWAEYAVAKETALVRLPDNLTVQEGESIPIAGKTALECMREINLNSGDSLFIAGASGAIGTLVIQLAQRKGIRISASASPKNHDYMKSLGAEQTVDYKDPDWRMKVKEWSNGGVDKVLAIQPGTGIDSIQVVKDGGELITVSGDNTSVSSQRNIEVRQMGHQLFTNHEMIELVNDIANEKIKVVIEKEYLFSNAIDALKKTETRRARGKLVVKIE
ncbi:MAG TPA: NADP-dependent oxidoreductase [Marinilabiliaceae bacterium]|nr:NADP-dependent oxidoreductase [Marinilabiliaceae bacterium]